MDQEEAGCLAVEFDRVFALWCRVGSVESTGVRYLAGLLRGHDHRAWIELATFLARRGDLRGAEAAYLQAIDRNEHMAEDYLRYFYRDHPGFRPPTSSEPRY